MSLFDNGSCSYCEMNAVENLNKCSAVTTATTSSLGLNQKSTTCQLTKLPIFRKKVFTKPKILCNSQVQKWQTLSTNANIQDEECADVGFEPPGLGQNENIKVLNYKKQKQQIAFNLKECEVNLDGIKRGLISTKAEIEQIRTAQGMVMAKIVSYCPSGPTEKLIELNEQQLQLHRRLIHLIDTEDKLMANLETHRRALSEARIADQTFRLDMEDKIDSIYKLYETREQFDYRRRLKKDKTIKKNAGMIRSKALKSWATKTQNRAQQVQDFQKTVEPESELLSDVVQENAQVDVIKKSRGRALNQKTKKHVKTIMTRHRMEKLAADADAVMRRSRQFSNLVTLRNQIYNQKDVLLAAAKARQRKAKRKQEFEARTKQELIEAGENPYIIAKLIKVTEQQKLMESAALEFGNQAIKKLAEEYDNEERQRLKKEQSKLKWGEFWENLAREKKRKARERDKQFYDEMEMEKDHSVAAGLIVTEATLTSAVEQIKHDPFNFDLLLSEQNKTIPLSSALPLPSATPTTAATVTKEESHHHPAVLPSVTSSILPDRHHHHQKSHHSNSQKLRRKTVHHATVAVEETITPKLDQEKEHGEPEVSKEKELEEPEVKLHTHADKEKSESHTHAHAHSQRKVSLAGAESTETLRSKGEIHELFVSSHSSHERKSKSKSKQKLSILEHSSEGKRRESGGAHPPAHEVASLPAPIPLKEGREVSLMRAVDPKLSLLPKISALALTKENKLPVRPEVNVEKLLDSGPVTNAFKWSPSIITFQDFIVGKTYKKKVTVTNLSLQIVKFYYKGLLSLDPAQLEGSETTKTSPPPSRPTSSKKLKSKNQKDEPAPAEEAPTTVKFYKITDLVLVDFKIPKPLSPGIAHSFTVTFTPEALGDWKGKLCFDSPSGSFFILVQCLKTRLVPTLLPPKVNFQHVVVNTSSSTTVKLQNVGEKAGTISRLRKLRDTSQSLTPLEELLRESVAGLPAETRQSRMDSVFGRTPGTTTTAVPTPQSSTSKNVAIPLKKAIKNFIEGLLTIVTENTFVVYIEENQRKLEAGEFVHLNIHFHPFRIGTFFTTYEIQFDDPEVEVLRLEIEGSGFENPLHVEPQHTNFKICLFDFNYQQVITITNSSKATGRIVPFVVPPLRHFVHIYPKETQLFPTYSTQFSIKFHPSKQMLMQPGIDEFFDEQTWIVDFPVYFDLQFPITMPGPLECTFQAVLTEAALDVSPTEIDFGTCLTTETVRSTVTTYNPSYLPQHIGFVQVPQHVSIQPNNGFGTLLPFETKKWDVLVSMTNELEGAHLFHVKVQSLEKSEQMIALRVVAKSHTISLSNFRICFPVTCCGSTASAILEIFSSAQRIKSRGHHTLLLSLVNKFEFIIDESFPIEIRPRSGHLEPGKSAKLLVSFTPTLTDDEVKAHFVNILRLQHSQKLGDLQRELQGIRDALDLSIVDEKALITEDVAKMKSDSMKSVHSTHSGTSAHSVVLTQNIRKKPTITNEDKDTAVRIRRKSKNGGGGGGPNTTTTQRKTSLKLGSTGTIQGDELGNFSAEEQNPRNTRKALERRANKLNKMLDQVGREFIGPEFHKISMQSDEVVRAKRDLIQNLSTKSTVCTVPCVITDHNGVEDVLLLNLKCPMQKPDLILLDEFSNTIDFDRVAIGSSTIRQVHLYNVSSGNLALKMDIINPYGPFLRVNALRKIPQDQVFTLKIQFIPTKEGYFEDTTVISGGDSQLVLLLTGTSIKPQFSIKPNKPDSFIGATKIRSLRMLKFEILNEGDVDLEFEIEGGLSGNFDGPDFPSEDFSVPSLPSSLIIKSPVGTPVAPPPTANKLQDHGKRTRRVSIRRVSIRKTSEHLNTPSDPNPDPSKRKRRKSSLGSHGSISSTQKPSKPKLALRDIPFEIQDGSAKKTVYLDELISFLDKTNQTSYFAPLESHLHVAAGKTGIFEVVFVPLAVGRYFRAFDLKLFGRTVQNFSVIGIGFEKNPASNTLTVDY